MKSPQPIEADKQKHGLELNIGSNIFRDTNGILKIQGKEQIVLEYRPEEQRLLVTMDLYNDQGGHIGHIRRNAIVFNSGNRFAFSPAPGEGVEPAGPGFAIHDRSTSDAVLEATALPNGKIQLLSGRFYTHKGQLVEITPHYCRIGGGPTLFGDIFENRGGTVLLG